MDHQDLRKAHSLGNEGHGVHVCHKCGWPFPNPHPSARHRRAHKKICGTIDGYKLVGSEVNTHLSVSDGEHSDEDTKTPGPKVLERSNHEKGSGLIGEASIQSDDAGFSDAVAEFSDSGSAAGTGEGLEGAQGSAANVERVANNDLNAIQFHNDGGTTGSTDNQFRGWLSASDISSKTSSISEGSKVLLGDSIGSENDLHPIKYETVTDASEGIKKTDATDSMIESCLTSVDQEAEVRGITATNLDRDISSKTSSISDGRTEDIKTTDATDNMIESCLTSVDQEAEVWGITATNLDRNISSKTISISDGRTEESNVLLGDRNGSEVDLHPIKYEMVTDASEDIKKTDATDSMIESCLTSVDQDTEVRGITATTINRNMIFPNEVAGETVEGASKLEGTDEMTSEYVRDDESEDIKKTDATDSMIESCLTFVDQDTEVRGITATTINRNMIFPNEVAGETVEGASKLEGTDEMISEYVRDDKVGPSEKEHSDGFDMRIPQIDLPPQVESVAHVNTSVDTAEKKVDDTDGIHYFRPGRLIESCNGKEDGNANVHVVSVPDDIHVVEDPVRMLEDFRNHKGKQLDQFTSLDSWEQFDDKENDIKQPVFKENLNIFQSSHLSGGTVVSPNMHDLEASLELDVGSSKPMIKRVPVEGEANMSQSEIKMSENQSSDELGSPADAVMPQIAKTYMVGFPEGQESYEKAIESLHVNFAASDAGIDQTTHSVGLDDSEKDGNCDGSGESGDHSRKGPPEENLVANPIATVQSAGDRYESQINPAANLHKDDDDGDYEKGVVEKCNIIGDADYNEKAETSNLFGDDKSKGATENFFSRDPANNLESDSCLSELQVNPVVNLHEGGDGAGGCEKDKTKQCDIIGNNDDHEKGEKYVSTSDDFSKRSTDKTFAEDPQTSSESIISLSDFQIQSGKRLPDVDGSADHDEGEIEKCVISGNESVEGSLEENILVKSELTPVSSSNLNDPKAVVEDATNGSTMELVETRHLDSSSNSWIVGGKIVSDTEQDVLKNEIACNDKIEKEVDAGAAAGSDHGHNVESFQKSLDDHGMKEPGFSALDTESSVQSFIASEDSGSREFHAVASGFTSQSLPEEGDNNLVRQHPSSSAVDASVDSNSQTDSLEANWGSVSVLSMQSDAVIDAEAVLHTNSQASLEGIDLKKSKAECESQYSDKSDMFEAPSFMTLVEPRGGDDQKATGSEILTAVQNPEQPKPASLQTTGWFPSITHVVNESQGRKKNEEIIAKVTNWSTGKQHTPLKSLLGEASLASKAKSPNQNESEAPTLLKDDKAGKVSGPVTTTVNSILNPESPTGQAAKKENAKEWNSPARYPSDPKSEKKKVKGRSWVQYVCCASVN